MMNYLPKWLWPKNDELDYSSNDFFTPEILGNIATERAPVTVEEIHETFYTEVDRLLADAKIMNSLHSEQQALLDKAKRLDALGFSNTSEAKAARGEMERLGALAKENQMKQDLAEAIDYFSQKYPTYKFITEQSVKKICEKYGLVYGGVDRYIGEVPEKNLKHIEEFSLNEVDRCFLVKGYLYGKYGHSETGHDTYVGSGDHINKMRSHWAENYNKTGISLQYVQDCTMEIAAPISDFNTEGMEVKSRQLVKVQDPVVLYPVHYKGMKHYLIVTAWGDEASDELVVNPKHN